MQPLNVVIALGDCIRAENLAIALHPFFRDVSVARDEEELRRKLARDHASAAVVDLEVLDVEQVAVLSKDFADVRIVCTHRVPDEDVWMKALSAGASDCCSVSDFKAIQEALTPREGQQELPRKKRKHAA